MCTKLSGSLDCCTGCEDEDAATGMDGGVRPTRGAAGGGGPSGAQSPGGAALQRAVPLRFLGAERGAGRRGRRAGRFRAGLLGARTVFRRAAPCHEAAPVDVQDHSERRAQPSPAETRGSGRRALRSRRRERRGSGGSHGRAGRAGEVGREAEGGGDAPLLAGHAVRGDLGRNRVARRDRQNAGPEGSDAPPEVDARGTKRWWAGMNERFTERDSELATASLRETAARIAPAREQVVLVERVVAGVTDSFFSMESPLGAVYVAVGSAGVRYLAPAASEEEFARRYRERFGRFVSPAEGYEAADLAEKVAAALAGERVEVPLDLSRATPFQRRVLEVVRGISRGEVRPYVWVADEAGSPGASRAVGNVMAHNPVPLLVPCHRVVGNDGDRHRLPRHLPQREEDPTPQPPRLPQRQGGHGRRLPALQGVPPRGGG